MLSRKISMPISLFASLLSTAIIFYGIQGKLTLYVHPRYVLFSVIMCCCALILSTYSLKGKAIHSQLSLPIILSLSFLSISILSFPPASLTSRTAQNRTQSSQVAASQSVSSFDRFSQDYSHFSLQDWSAYLSSSPKVSEVIGKSAKVEGFIYDDSSGNRYVARFKLSCCAVDATPLSIKLAKTNDVMSLQSGSWFEIEGKFSSNDSTSFALEPTKITSIPQPKEQYVY